MPKLTETFLKTFRPADGAKDRMAFDTECRGLGVRATASGNVSFIVQWTDAATGRKLREPLGTWGAITVEQARIAARARLGRIAQGINPAAERAAAKAEDQRQRDALAAAREEARFTLDALIADWAKLHLARKRPRYAAEAERALRVAFKADLGQPASGLTHTGVTAVLDKLAGDGKAAIAGRTMAYGRACYGWAVRRRRLAANPFEGLPAIEGANASRDRVLTDDEVGAIWRASLAMAEPWGPLVRLLLVTLARREEVAGMRWSELNPDLSQWVIPAARMKLGKPHVVALTDAGRAVLASVTRIEGQDLVFSTTGRTQVSGFSKVKVALDKASGVSGWRFHDFLRTGVSALAGLGFDSVVADKLLAHQPHALSAVARVYQRHDFAAERKAALEAWSACVLRCGDGRQDDPADNVADLIAHKSKRAERLMA